MITPAEFEKRLKEILYQNAEAKIVEVIVGLGYTYVETELGIGLAYTFRFETDYTCSPLREAGTIAGRKIGEIVPWLDDKNLLKRSVAIAALNSTLPLPPFEEMDIAEIPEVLSTKTVGMVGFFEPVVKRLQEKGKKVLIFEKQPYEGEDFYRDWDIPFYLPETDFAIITATSIINKTLIPMLSILPSTMKVALLGPTTPLLPSLFSETPVTYLAGSLINDKNKVRRIIMEGAGSRIFGKSVKRIIVKAGESSP